MEMFQHRVDPKKCFETFPKDQDNHERTSFKGYLFRPMSISISLCFLNGRGQFGWAPKHEMSQPYADGDSPQRYLLLTIHKVPK